MGAFMKHIYHFALNAVKLLTILLMAGLLLGALIVTCYADDMESQQVLVMHDNLLGSVVGIVIYLAAAACCILLVRRFGKRFRHILLFLTFGIILLGGGVLIVFGRTVPAADAMSVYSIAGALAKGDVSVIHPTESYLSYYPQQVGLVAFLEILIRFWNVIAAAVPAWHFIKGIYVLLVCLIVFFQYKTIPLLWSQNADEISCVYLLLVIFDLPFVMYSSFVYGEIPSFTAFAIGLYFLLKLLRERAEHPALCGSASVFFFALSVMLRKNSLILLIAVILVIAFDALRHPGAKALRRIFLCACIGIFGVFVLPLVQKGYELRSGSTISSGVPATAYFAMGMQEASRGCGWYNGYNFNTYADTGMDTALTKERSRQAIRERLDYFAQNPGYAAEFYLAKELSQWTDGTYASRQATLATLGGRSAFVKELYEGSLSKFYIYWCNHWQNILYLGAFLFCLLPYLRKSDPDLIQYLGLIGVLGGFLFHTIWEANSRYIFLYSLLLIPYAAFGMQAQASGLLKKIAAMRSKRDKCA